MRKSWIQKEEALIARDVAVWGVDQGKADAYLSMVDQSAVLFSLARGSVDEQMRHQLALVGLRDALVDSVGAALEAAAILLPAGHSASRARILQAKEIDRAAALLDRAGQSDLASAARQRSIELRAAVSRPGAGRRLSQTMRCAYELERALSYDASLDQAQRHRLIGSLLQGLGMQTTPEQIRQAIKDTRRRARRAAERRHKGSSDHLAVFFTAGESALLKVGIAKQRPTSELLDLGAFSGARAFIRIGPIRE